MTHDEISSLAQIAVPENRNLSSDEAVLYGLFLVLCRDFRSEPRLQTPLVASGVASGVLCAFSCPTLPRDSVLHKSQHILKRLTVEGSLSEGRAALGPPRLQSWYFQAADDL